LIEFLYEDDMEKMKSRKMCVVIY